MKNRPLRLSILPHFENFLKMTCHAVMRHGIIYLVQTLLKSSLETFLTHLKSLHKTFPNTPEIITEK